MTGLARRLVFTAFAFLSVHCGDSAAPGTSPEPAPEAAAVEETGRKATRGSFVQLARVEGYANPLTGEIDIRAIPIERPKAPDGVAVHSQALGGFCELTVASDGNPNTNPPGTFQFYTVGPVTPDTSDDSSFDPTTCHGRLSSATTEDLGRFNLFGVGCALQNVGNFTSQTFSHVYLDVDLFYGDTSNSPYGYPYTTGTTETPTGRNAPNAAEGLWDFGSFAPGEQKNMWLYFRNGAPASGYRWSGFLVAEVLEDCGNATDDDCDGVVNNGCAEEPEGGDCYFDDDCSVGTCQGASVVSGLGQGGLDLDDDVPGSCLPVCGDGVVEGSEQCDDDNNVPGDGCSASCALETPQAPDCGSAIAIGGYGGYAGSTVGTANDYAGSCSSGAGEDLIYAFTAPVAGAVCIDTAGSSFDTQLHVQASCGDALTELACNDDSVYGVASQLELTVAAGVTYYVVVDGYGAASSGNFQLNVNAGSCSTCGDAVCAGTEDCGSCPTDCGTCTSCGDFVVTAPETCDDGNDFSGDGCDAFCQVEPSCGDFAITAPETCDDGNDWPGDGCDEFCQIEPVCGDSVIDAPETCDDGNDWPGDGCDEFCQTEPEPVADWLVTWGDADDDAPARPIDVVVDMAGNVYVLSTFLGSIEVAGSSYGGNAVSSILIALAPDGSLRWVAPIESPNAEVVGARIAIDPSSGDPIVIGNASGEDAVYANGSYVGYAQATSTAFALRFYESWGGLAWGHMLTPDVGSATELHALTINGHGSILAAGALRGAAELAPGTWVSSAASTADGVLVWLDPWSGWPMNHVLFGGTEADEVVTALGILPGSDDFVVAGTYLGGDADVFGRILPAGGGGTGSHDAFFARLAWPGVAAHVGVLSTASDERWNDLRIGPSGDYYLAGTFSASTTLGASSFSVTGHGGLVARIDAASGAVQWARAHAGEIDAPSGVTRLHVDAGERVWATYGAQMAGLTDPSFGGVVIPATGTFDVHVVRMSGDSGAVEQLDVHALGDRGLGGGGTFTAYALGFGPDSQAVIAGSFDVSGTLGNVSFLPSGTGSDQFALKLHCSDCAPTPRTTRSYASIASGWVHACAITQGGGVRCWGDDSFGALGVHSVPLATSAPKLNLGSADAVSIAAGKAFNCAIFEDDRVRCWGDNAAWQARGQAGADVRASTTDPMPASLAVGGTPVRLALGEQHACVARADGGVRCWGQNDVGQCGAGNTSATKGVGSGDVLLPSGAADVCAGSHHACALLHDGQVYCWGANAFGQLGYGHTTAVTDPSVAGPVDALSPDELSMGLSVRQVACGGNDTCVILNDGSARCWGEDTHGQLGYGTVGAHVGDDELPSSAGLIALPGAVRQLTTGDGVTCALLDYGDLHCWGWTGRNGGCLGHGGTCGEDVATPPWSAIDFAGLSAMALGQRSTSSVLCARLQDSGVKCWSRNTGNATGLDVAQNPIDPPSPMYTLPPFFVDCSDDGFDNDGNGMFDEPGEPCSPCAHDGLDNDGNGMFDEPFESCTQPVCDADAADNDGNGVTDEPGEPCGPCDNDGVDNDVDYITDEWSEPCSPPVCDADGIDDDLDGTVDELHETCTYPRCGFDGADNDGNGTADEWDEPCYPTVCAFDAWDNDEDFVTDEAMEPCSKPICDQDGIDNDGDWNTDEYEEGCYAMRCEGDASDNDEDGTIDEPGETCVVLHCDGDGIDNDGTGYADEWHEPCYPRVCAFDAWDNDGDFVTDEAMEPCVAPVCDHDGIDNDFDWNTDEPGEGCYSAPCEGNAVDDDEDGTIDETGETCGVLVCDRDGFDNDQNSIIDDWREPCYPRLCPFDAWDNDEDFVTDEAGEPCDKPLCNTDGIDNDADHTTDEWDEGCYAPRCEANANDDDRDGLIDEQGETCDVIACDLDGIDNDGVNGTDEWREPCYPVLCAFDGVDNDGNGFSDDPFEPCGFCDVDGLDNDGNGVVDEPQEACFACDRDGFDNDGSGYPDEPGEPCTTCEADGRDNDQDLAVDELDEPCFVALCDMNFLDDDYDGSIDELAERCSPDACDDDGLDNDADGGIDELYEPCAPPVCVFDGTDNDSDTVVDEAGERCSVPVCSTNGRDDDLDGTTDEPGESCLTPVCDGNTDDDDSDGTIDESGEPCGVMLCDRDELDNDGDFSADEADEPCQRVVCAFDGLDNDANGVVDDAMEPCVAPTCDADGLDNDGDFVADESGEGCSFTPCDADGQDNDLDGLRDEPGEPCGYARCDADGVDNDGDFVADEPSEPCMVAVCAFDGTDNDLDFATDEAYEPCDTPRCDGDGLDNDADGTADEPSEGCYAQLCTRDGLNNDLDWATDEVGETCGVPACDKDGFDNDFDGTADEADEACMPALCPADSLDNDGNGVVDEPFERCAPCEFDGEDNDGNGVVDEADEPCSACDVDELDNDGSGYVDEPGEPCSACDADGRDNDFDAVTDETGEPCFGPICDDDFFDNDEDGEYDEPGEPCGVELCEGDGFDNDGDLQIDEPGERCVPALCTSDWTDNDLDFETDEAGEPCEQPVCDADGRDNNLDGATDEWNESCYPPTCEYDWQDSDFDGVVDEQGEPCGYEVCDGDGLDNDGRNGVDEWREPCKAVLFCITDGTDNDLDFVYDEAGEPCLQPVCDADGQDNNLNNDTDEPGEGCYAARCDGDGWTDDDLDGVVDEEGETCGYAVCDADGLDNDADSVTDEHREPCAAVLYCITDYTDNDLDFLTDEQDEPCVQPVCSADGQDNDLNGATDEWNESCYPPRCEHDGDDSDLDGSIDEAGEGCGYAVCDGDALDNDGDVMVDEYREPCLPVLYCVSDGLDNDADYEWDEAGEPCDKPMCNTDGEDNDLDYATDEWDEGCYAPRCEHDGDDSDLDGVIDEAGESCGFRVCDADGVDNDGRNGVDEWREPCLPLICAFDGFDNDGNGGADEPDEPCDTCEANGLDDDADGVTDEPAEACSPAICDTDGRDNDADGMIDDRAERCVPALCDANATDDDVDGATDERGERCSALVVLGQADFASANAGGGSGGMNEPSAVAIDRMSRKVFVADAQNHRVLRFASSSALQSGQAAEAVFGQPDLDSSSPGVALSQMHAPRGVFVDAWGALWVADTGNHRVLRFDHASYRPSGAFANGVLGQATASGAAPPPSATSMSHPHGVFADDYGRLWVADTGNHRVLRFDLARAKPHGAAADGVLGQRALDASVPNTRRNRMRGPQAVWLDADHRLWVADTGNHRVLGFELAAGSPDGDNAEIVLGQASFNAATASTSATGMRAPSGVTTLGAQLFVADRDNHRVLVFDDTATLGAGGDAASSVIGQADFVSAAPGTSERALHAPRQIATDPVTGGVWIADAQNHRALRAPLQVSTAVAPLGFWRMEEGSGSTLLDSSGQGHDASVISGGWVSGYSGLGFAGEAELLEWQPSSWGSTMAAWVQRTGTHAGFGRITSWSGDAFEVGVIPGSESLGVYSSGLGGWVDTGAELPLGTWTHIAVSVQSYGAMRAFVDGELVYEAAADYVSVGGSFALGHHADGWEPGFSGVLDDVQIYDHELTGAEVQDLASSGP